MTTYSSLLQKVRHDIKKTSLCREVCHDVKSFVITSKIRQMFVMKSKIRHDVKKLAMTSKSHDVMTKTRHDIKKSVMTSKTCHDVTKFVIRQKHVETSKFWHQFYISTMCRPPVINDYVFSTNLVTLTLDLLNNINHWHKNTQLELFLTLLSCNYNSTISIKTNRSKTWTLPMMSPALTS